MKRIIVSILAAGAAALAIAAPAHAEEMRPGPSPVEYRGHPRFERAHRRSFERRRHQRVERRYGYGYDRW